MDVDRVVKRIDGVPHMRARRGRQLSEFLLKERPQRMLELGTSHGVSACYMAAAAQECGGHVTSMDRSGIEKLDPNVHELLGDLGLVEFADIGVADRSFTWELMRILRDEPDRRFDFCFFDGGHSWDVTGYAFFLVDLLLEPGSWILFDDLNWTFDSSPSLRRTADVKDMADEERSTPQVGLVFDLLVARNPRYDNVSRDGNWGWARKIG